MDLRGCELRILVKRLESDREQGETWVLRDLWIGLG
jgi:hypothetical protein